MHRSLRCQVQAEIERDNPPLIPFRRQVEQLTREQVRRLKRPGRKHQGIRDANARAS